MLNNEGERERGSNHIWEVVGAEERHQVQPRDLKTELGSEKEENLLFMSKGIGRQEQGKHKRPSADWQYGTRGARTRVAEGDIM